jgi:hypothetical protein
MKKRTMLIPAAVLALLMACSSKEDESYEKKDADVRNKYKSLEDCRKDNPADKVKDGCENVTTSGHPYYLGPAYPRYYYGHSGFYEGYWMGRITSGSTYVVTREGSVISHAEIAKSGGSINSAKPSSVVRGGFGSTARSGFVGGS